jgi:formylglycine-generating enzyme required for sulfatase activity
MSEREVRYRDFMDVVKHEPGHQPKHPDHQPAGVVRARCTWFDCIEFCNRLSEREGLSPAYAVSGQSVTLNRDAAGYRLPTEAEWEFACRAGTTSLWYFGLTAAEAEAMRARSLPKAQSYLRAQSEKANAFGLFAMYGSSAEWCWDWYSTEYYRDCADRDVVVDPQGPESGTRRVVRGGTYYSHSSGDLATINSAARESHDPIQWAGVNGFGRLVLPISEKGTAGSATRARAR